MIMEMAYRGYKGQKARGEGGESRGGTQKP